MGALGGIIFLVGMAVAFIGHRHMGEGPSENYRGAPVYPIETFIVGRVLMGIGVVVMVSSCAGGFDKGSLDYSDFFPESSG